MKRYEEQILHILLDKYEESLLYTEQNKRNMTIGFPIRKGTLPEYFDESSSVYDVIHEQLWQAEQAGYLRLVWKNGKPGHILEKCVLNTDKLDEIYQFLKRSPKRKQQERFEEILNQYQERGPVLRQFCSWMLERLSAGESVKRYGDLEDPEGLERLCRLVCKILENQEELYIREFSVRHFHDTKLAEREIGKAVEVIRRFSKGDSKDGEDHLEELTTEQILEEFSIYRNPSWVMMKGCGIFFAGNNQIELDHFSGGIGIHSGDLKNLSWDLSSPIYRVLTIENLTTFHRMEEKDTLMIYLAGYHNRVKREFLMKLYEAFPKAEYFHFGDLDCGGFLIWKNLCRNTGIPFSLYRMDKNTLDKYLAFGRNLTERDRQQLKKMKEDPFFFRHQPVLAVLEEMLFQGKKLEQEGIDFHSW